MKKIFLVLFSLIMMFSVSFGIEANVEYNIITISTSENSECSIGTFSSSMIKSILKNYISNMNNESYKASYESLITTLKENNYKYVVYTLGHSTSNLGLIVVEPSFDADIVCLDKTYSGEKYDLLAILCNDEITQTTELGHVFSSLLNCLSNYPLNVGYDVVYCDGLVSSVTSIIDCNTNIYDMGGNKYWDGITYKYEAPENSGGVTDSNFPEFTDEQIAEVVERFVNSEAYLTNNKYDYDDFFITYDNLTGYYRAYSYHENMDLAISYGNYNEDGEFVATGTEEGEAWQIRPYVFDGNIFRKLYDWLASIHNNVSFEYYSISPDSTINPRYIGYLEHSYCSNYKENEVVIYSTKQIRYIGEKTNSEGETETEVIDDYIPKTTLINSETGEEIVIKNLVTDSSTSLENIITPNADFSGLKEAFEKYISFVNISSITWLTTAISSMITIFIPFVALGIIIFLINRILNGGS